MLVNWIISPSRGENKKYLKPPPRNGWLEEDMSFREGPQSPENGIPLEDEILGAKVFGRFPSKLKNSLCFAKNQEYDIFRMGNLELNLIWLVVSTHLKKISQIGSFP